MTEDEFYQLLEQFHLDYLNWNKPAAALYRAVAAGEIGLFPTETGLHQMMENVWLVISHITPEGKKFYVYEKWREFPNGVRHSRNRFVALSPAPGSELFPVAISETRQRAPSGQMELLMALIERAVLEEWRKRLVRKRLVIERTRLIETHASVAHKGITTHSWGTIASLYASTREFGKGTDVVTTDENGIKTCLASESEDAMHERRARYLLELSAF